MTCRSLGVGTSIQLTTEESPALDLPSCGSWRRILFLDSRKLELYFQLELNIKELLEKHSSGFFLEEGFHLKNCVHLCSFY